MISSTTATIFLPKKRNKNWRYNVGWDITSPNFIFWFLNKISNIYIFRILFYLTLFSTSKYHISFPILNFKFLKLPNDFGRKWVLYHSCRARRHLKLCSLQLFHLSSFECIKMHWNLIRETHLPRHRSMASKWSSPIGPNIMSRIHPLSLPQSCRPRKLILQSTVTF